MLGKKSKSEAAGWVSTKNGVFDYSKCQFEVRLQKKVFLGTQTRYVYCTPSTIVIAKEPYQKKPDKIVYLQPSWRVVWLFNPKKSRETFENRVIGFRIIMHNENTVTATNTTKDNSSSKGKSNNNSTSTKDTPTSSSVTSSAAGTNTSSDNKIEYFGDSLVMMTLRDFFSKQLFQLKFLDEFEIQKKIGKGKYAKVYKVRRKEDNKCFAVKYLHKNKLATIEDAQAALLNELKILRMVTHVNCLELRATYEDENGYYILTDLLDPEKQLQGELSKHSDPKEGYAAVRSMLKQLIKGIEYVHSLGIMHRDLKPQNIMFALPSSPGAEQMLKIIDFGLAQFVNDPHYIYVHVGTPGYVAPEILSNESDKHRYTSKCDLFSIGVVFHILLTGRSVFPGKKFSQVLSANKECKIDFRGSKYEQLDAAAMELLISLLEANPEKRCSATQALQHRFFQQTSSQPIAAMKFIPKEPAENITYQPSLPTLPDDISTHIGGVGLHNRAPLQKGFHNLANARSAKDIDAAEIDFAGMLSKMKSITPISAMLVFREKDENPNPQHFLQLEQRLRAIFLDLIDLFVMLEENQNDDLSFFACPIKPNNNLQNVRINHQDVLAVVELDEDEEENAQQNQEEAKSQSTETQSQQHQQQQQQNMYTIGQNEMDEDNEQMKQLPKNMLTLLSLFPSELLEAEMHGDLKRERRLMLRLVARFLVFGFGGIVPLTGMNGGSGNGDSISISTADTNILSDEMILEVLSRARESMCLSTQFIGLVEEMLCPQEDNIPHFLYLKTAINNTQIHSHHFTHKQHEQQMPKQEDGQLRPEELQIP